MSDSIIDTEVEEEIRSLLKSHRQKNETIVLKEPEELKQEKIKAKDKEKDVIVKVPQEFYFLSEIGQILVVEKQQIEKAIKYVELPEKDFVLSSVIKLILKISFFNLLNAREEEAIEYKFANLFYIEKRTDEEIKNLLNIRDLRRIKSRVKRKVGKFLDYLKIEVFNVADIILSERHLANICGFRDPKKGICSLPKGFGTKHLGKGNCKFHGGLNRSYIESLPDNLQETYQDYLNEGEITSLNREIALLRTKIEDLMENHPERTNSLRQLMNSLLSAIEKEKLLREERTNQLKKEVFNQFVVKISATIKNVVTDKILLKQLSEELKAIE